MARINPDKLVKNFTVRSSVYGQLEAFWDLPTSFVDGEEIVVCRRKDAFPVEIRNRNYEDRYTDVVQVEVFRGSPIHCSHLVVSGNTLVIAGDNQFNLSITEFDRDGKYSGRLIRDSLGQVFRIVTNTENVITYENVATNPNKQVQAVEGEFVILADFSKTARPLQTLELLSNAFTLNVASNTLVMGDKLTINNTVELNYGVQWSAGATVDETASNLQAAIIASGTAYTVTVFGTVLLIEKNTETTLAVASNTASLVVTEYAASNGVLFVADNTFLDNEIRYLSLQDADSSFYMIQSNLGKAVYLYDNDIVVNGPVNILPSFNNTYPSPFIDKYKGYLDALTKRGTGLEPDTFYYYTTFNSPVTSLTVMSNEVTSGGEDLTPYTIDKIASYYVRVFYETLVYTIPVGASFSYNDGTGLITYSPTVDLTLHSPQIGDLFADAQGKRYAITSVANADIGQISVAPNSGVSTERRTQLHGSITRANPPANISAVRVGDTFKDLAGNSFPIVATPSSPLSTLTTPPGNAFDVAQGLVDEVVELNTFLIPFTYNASNGRVQFGERQVTENSVLSTFTYNTVSGLIQYDTNIDLSAVKIGYYFIDGANNQFKILSVNPQALQLTIATLQTVDLTIVNRRSGSVIELVGFRDAEDNSLINLSNVQKYDLFKTNSKAVYVIGDVDAANGLLDLSGKPDSISVVVSSEFDGSISRRGSDVAWIGFNGEFIPTLQDIAQGGVKRYNSVTNTQYALLSNPLSTQAFAIHAQDRKLGQLLYNRFPNLFRITDLTGDLEDLMQVFGHEFNDLYAIITKFELQNADVLTPSVLQITSQDTGFDLVSENLGIDTRRRVMRDLILCYKLKGNRDGIARFIKVLTTWDITNGTGDTRGAIIDDTPESVGLRFYSPSLGDLNTRLVDTLNVKSPPAGRFVKGVPGLSLPGFFNVKEVIIDLPNIALDIGSSTGLNYMDGNTILGDSNANFGLPNSLIGSFIIPDEGSPNDFYEILGNDATSITVAGSIPFMSLGAKYIVLSPLNLSRFVSLSKEIVNFMPYNTVAIFNFTILTI